MSWKKKIEKSVSDDLLAGEQLIEGLLINPSGHTMNLAARGIGGLAGAAIANRVRKNVDTDSSVGIATQLPNEPLVLGITDRRLVVWGWAKLTGRPKGLKAAFALADVAGMETEVRKASVLVELVFADGSSITREAPRLGNNVEEFAAAINAANPG